MPETKGQDLIKTIFIEHHIDHGRQSPEKHIFGALPFSVQSGNKRKFQPTKGHDNFL